MISDDAVLRGLAMAEYSISGIWTQPLLMHLLGTGELSQPDIPDYAVA